MDTNYTIEKNVLNVIAFMKAYGVKKVVVSPGTTNITFVASIQSDPYFTLFSSVDERSAAYIACGLAAETNEPVALSCTGATASRNYISGLTEAFYRKLPVLAITSTQHPGRIGTYTAQVLDRTKQLNDMVVYSAQIMAPSTPEDEWAMNVELNKAFIALKKNGGGPVHINLMTNYSKDFTAKEIPKVRTISHIGYHDRFPKFRKGRIAVLVGAHTAWSNTLTAAVNRFCEIYGAVVFCEHISNYKGPYRVSSTLLCMQEQFSPSCIRASTEIYIGYISGASFNVQAKEVWRVNPDGEIRDKSHKTTKVFQMEEVDFFNAYIHLAEKGISMFDSEESCSSISFKRESNIDVTCGEEESDFFTLKEIMYSDDSGRSDVNIDMVYSRFDDINNKDNNYLELCRLECQSVSSKIPELPFSNAWIAQHTSDRLPEGCVLHLGILNTVRVWNFFDIPDSVLCYANTGGFGIDGDISSLVGASLAHPDKLYFGIVGDLAFFYDMNVLGNRHFGNNIRLMLINNGKGTEFRNFNHPAARFGDDADPYMAAAGHFGKQSKNLVKHYALDLGFEYLSADSKETYLKESERFIVPENTDRPMLFEVFTDSKNESEALKILYNIETNTRGKVKKIAKEVIGDKGIDLFKRFKNH